MYLKGPPNLDLCVSKKNRDRTTHQSDYMSGKMKKVEIFEKMRLKYAEQSNVLSQKIFKRSLKNFIEVL